MIDPSKAAAGNIESFEDIMIRQAKLDGVSAARDHRTQPVYADASNGDLVYGRTRPGEYKVARISRVAIHFRHVTRVQKRCNILQLLVCPRWTNLIRDGVSRGTAKRFFMNSPSSRGSKRRFHGDTFHRVDAENIAAISHSASQSLARVCSEHVRSHFQLRKNQRLDLSRKKHGGPLIGERR
jgi:hypothetical protein